MKTKFLLFCLLSTCMGCNLSDDVIDLPMGHQFINEGSCSNLILINIKGISNIEYVQECKFNDSYICVSYTDSLSCRRNDISEMTTMYKIIDVKTNTVSESMNRKQFDVFYSKKINDVDLLLK